MDDLKSGITGLSGKSTQVFAFFSPDGVAHFVAQPSTWYLPRLRILRNLIIQFISDNKTDIDKFNEILEELRCDQSIWRALPEEITLAVSLSQLVLVLLERSQTQANACKWVVSVFEKLIRELELGRINYYDDSDFEIRPLTAARKRIDVQLSTLAIERIQDPEFVHENIKTLLHRMDASIKNADPAGALHASASIFETLAKDIVGIPTCHRLMKSLIVSAETAS